MILRLGFALEIICFQNLEYKPETVDCESTDRILISSVIGFWILGIIPSHSFVYFYIQWYRYLQFQFSTMAFQRIVSIE